MVAAVLYAFAVVDGLKPAVGAAPYDVLARQLPRLLVMRLNGAADRGVRFFPFLGMVDGTRSFLRLNTCFEPKQLIKLHKQGDARFLCDGILREGFLHWRVVDGESARVLLEIDLPFDPSSPTEVLTRLEFELMELLGWSGRPQPASELGGESLGWFLILRDVLLRREAGLVDDGQDPLLSARKGLELAPSDPDVATVTMDLAGHMLRANERREEVASVLRVLVDATELPVAHFERLGALLLTAGDQAMAATATMRAARSALDRVDLVERCVGLLFRLERYREAGDLVELARQRGVASLTSLAQYAACCDRVGDEARRAVLCNELLAEHDLPAAVARLLVSFLLEDERPESAREVAERALAADAAQPALQFDLGRARLSLGDCAQAVVALQESLRLGLPAEVEMRAYRLLRLASRPGLWVGSQDVEAALERGDHDAALSAVVKLARCAPDVAEVWFMAGLVRHRRGEQHRAERSLRRALRLDDELYDAHNRLGILLVTKGQLEEGLTHLQRAHGLAPGESSPMLHLAQALALLGRVDEAQRFVELAAEAGADAALVEAVRREVLSSQR